MTATAITPTAVTRSAPADLSAVGTAVDAANDMTFPNDGTTLFRMKTSGTIITVTFVFANPTPDGVTITPTGKQLVMAATGDRLAGPFPVNLYGSTVTVKFSVATGGTCFVYQPGA